MQETDQTQMKSFSQASFLIMVILFILRYPLLFLGELEIIPSFVAFIIYLVITYFLTGLFIFLNRNDLKRYNITNIALLIFIAAPLLALIAGNGDDPTVWLRLVVAIILAIMLFYKRKDWLQKSRLEIGTMFVNIVITVALCVVVPFIIHAIRGFPVIETPSNNLIVSFDVPYILTFQLSSAAISEEPLFRGILWGYLRTKGMKDGWICLVQAGLFWVGHIYYIGTGINFWIIHPLLALLFGIVVWKFKSISHSMIFHTCVNTFTDYLRHVPYV